MIIVVSTVYDHHTAQWLWRWRRWLLHRRFLVWVVGQKSIRPCVHFERSRDRERLHLHFDRYEPMCLVINMHMAKSNNPNRSYGIGYLSRWLHMWGEIESCDWNGVCARCALRCACALCSVLTMALGGVSLHDWISRQARHKLSICGFTESN